MPSAASTPSAAILDAIAESTARASELTRQLLCYAGKQQLGFERLELAELVASSGELLRLALAPEARLELDLAATSVFEADPTQLRQIVLNLVINASQALPESGGHVRVTTRDYEYVGELDGRVVPNRKLAPGVYAMLEVRDDGHGIAPELARLGPRAARRRRRQHPRRAAIHARGDRLRGRRGPRRRRGARAVRGRRELSPAVRREPTAPGRGAVALPGE